MEGFDPAAASPLPTSFFERDTVTVARDLLGAVLVSTAGDAMTAGVVVETEAYLGTDDPGSHAATKGITDRNSVMYGPPGRAYVYFTYGNHHMLNVVTGPAGTAGAVLIRAVEPVLGADVMALRRGRKSALADGPGKLAQAMGIDLSDNGSRFGEGRLGLYRGETPQAIKTSGRIGLSQGHESMLRFFIEGNVHVSRGRTGPRISRAKGRGRTDV